ncbi:histidine phosphatase family protein [Pedobacter sp. MC2016-24]|uniref:histidine phosphatase family protein n=1 Tax=Pedobacter sp. MC2016-24 TaxID=2780090 RepID=UPI00188203B8|nr:histidine phosphatase family protein [Pedobacter sp. MC2016-24]MBE9598119.1 histidine phosphatase family protein [Pedobacter sp. MC2016-24]
MTKELYIIRHGETDLNKQGIVQGRGINSDLNDTGRAQAAAFYLKYKDVPFDKVYTSALKRTHQTVKGFIDAGLPWQQLSGLDELAWGVWEGKANNEAAITAFKGMMEQWEQGNYDAHFEGGESPNDVIARQKQALEVIENAVDEQRILICMHGRAMRLFLCLLTGKPLSEMTEFPHLNTTLYKVEQTADQFVITEFNNTDHLK